MLTRFLRHYVAPNAPIVVLFIREIGSFWTSRDEVYEPRRTGARGII